MCGIAGTIHSIDPAATHDMLTLLRHRGDEAPQLTVTANAVMGCCRLRIVDRPGGIQPLRNEDGTLTVVFNGEIYNHMRLRRILEEKGHRFTTTSDTEILVHLYEEYGENMLSLLDGMFAFVIVDDKTRSFFAARDRIGVKPFFYCWHKGIFHFSSEMKALVSVPATEIFELGPSHCIRDGFVKPWDFPAFEPDQNIPFLEAREKLRELMIRAVEKRVATDLPIGILFSGGLDSTITLLLAQRFHPDVTALILGEEWAEDVIFAKRVCTEKGIRYVHESFTPQQLFDSLPGVIYTIESFEPNPVRGSVLSILLGRMAHRLGLRVILCGEGSDEIFAGYGDFIGLDDREFQNLSLHLLGDLYRTQLLRVDRTSMACGVEVREPFLDKDLVTYAMSLLPSYKVNFLQGGQMITKFILREAFRDILPSYVYNRPKMTLMEGAGAGVVDRGKGMFYDFACTVIGKQALEKWKSGFPQYDLRDEEEVYYFSIFYSHFCRASFAAKRTFNAQKEIKPR